MGTNEDNKILKDRVIEGGDMIVVGPVEARDVSDVALDSARDVVGDRVSDVVDGNAPVLPLAPGLSVDEHIERVGNILSNERLRARAEEILESAGGLSDFVDDHIREFVVNELMFLLVESGGEIHSEVVRKIENMRRMVKQRFDSGEESPFGMRGDTRYLKAAWTDFTGYSLYGISERKKLFSLNLVHQAEGWGEMDLAAVVDFFAKQNLLSKTVMYEKIGYDYGLASYAFYRAYINGQFEDLISEQEMAEIFSINAAGYMNFVRDDESSGRGMVYGNTKNGGTKLSAEAKLIVYREMRKIVAELSPALNIAHGGTGRDLQYLQWINRPKNGISNTEDSVVIVGENSGELNKRNRELYDAAAQKKAEQDHREAAQRATNEFKKLLLVSDSRRGEPTPLLKSLEDVVGAAERSKRALEEKTKALAGIPTVEAMKKYVTELEQVRGEFLRTAGQITELDKVSGLNPAMWFGRRRRVQKALKDENNFRFLVNFAKQELVDEYNDGVADEGERLGKSHLLEVIEMIPREYRVSMSFMMRQGIGYSGHLAKSEVDFEVLNRTIARLHQDLEAGVSANQASLDSFRTQFESRLAEIEGVLADEKYRFVDPEVRATAEKRIGWLQSKMKE